jgi:enamine deaminase RidA (YjgF/YER057c/UK114 family)
MRFETVLKRIGNEMIRHLPIAAVALVVSLTASAQTTKRIPLPLSQNARNADLPIAAAVWAGDTLYVSGWLDPDIKTHPDTPEPVRQSYV